MVRDASDDQKLKSLGQPGSQLRPLLAATADPVAARVVLKVADLDLASRIQKTPINAFPPLHFMLSSTLGNILGVDIGKHPPGS